LPAAVIHALQGVYEAFESDTALPDFIAVAFRKTESDTPGAATVVQSHDVFEIKAPDPRLRTSNQFELRHYDGRGVQVSHHAIRPERLQGVYQFALANGKLELLPRAPVGR
jgi:hypothetical protein